MYFETVKATGFNYRVVSCNACKAFFRRAVLAGKTFECRFKTMSDPVDCMSNPQWLKICQHCRLLKCRQVGMRDEYVHNLRIQEMELNDMSHMIRIKTKFRIDLSFKIQLPAGSI